MRRLLPPALALLVLGCASPKYLFVDSGSLQKEISAADGRMPIQRYVLSPDNFPADSLWFLDSAPAKSFLAVLKKNNRKKTKSYIESPAFQSCADPAARRFCKSLYYFFSSAFDSCTMLLDASDLETKSCFLRFIRTDCEYETTVHTGTVTYDEFAEKYQKILDCNDNALSRQIVKIRLKLIRYGY
jgi:hypothetical protein